jgi:hypothetical protein
MITMPADVLATDVSGGWDGESEDKNTGNVNPNKETGMSWAEHQRIVCAARNLLTTEIQLLPDEVKTVFDTLKSAFNEQGSKYVVRVSKGIHQPTVNPHIQLYLQGTYRQKGEVYLKDHGKMFHLNLSAVDTAEKSDSFQWKGVQFSYKHNGMSYQWPVNAVITKKSLAVGRRNSVSSVDLQAFINKLAHDKVVAENQLKQDKFDAAWATLIAKHKPSNNKPTKNFHKGDTVIHLKANPRAFHIKYDPDTALINKTNSTGGYLEAAY